MRQESLSQRLFAIDWSAASPWTFDDVVAEAVTFDEASPFISEHYASLFEADASTFFVESMSPAKLRFAREMDYFAFKARGKIVGLHVAHPTDWSTYYLRSASILPEYRRLALLPRLQEQLERVLGDAGVRRVEAETSPANVPMVKMLTSLGFMVTGQSCSERWGLVLRWTKHLDPEARRSFMDHYSTMAFRHVESR